MGWASVYQILSQKSLRFNLINNIACIVLELNGALKDWYIGKGVA